MSYQEIDLDIIDYGDCPLPGTPLSVRGPIPSNLTTGPYLSFLGAAQTYGRFVEKPFPNLLSRQLKVESLNLGWAGAGPGYYLPRHNLLNIVNRSSVVIVQVMSGRSISNSYFENINSDRLIPHHLKDDPNEKPKSSLEAWQRVLDERGTEFIRKLVAETREIYVAKMTQLLHAINRPKVLFYFSTRPIDYKIEYSHAGTIFGAFPHLINSEMLSEIRKHATEYVECISSRGLPQPLFYKGTSTPYDQPLEAGPVGFNNYYPSPEMHVDAVAALFKVISGLLN